MSIVVLGAGSWGTALAILLAENHNHVVLWGREPELMADMLLCRENKRFLPGINIPENITIEPSLEKALSLSRDILIAVPSQAFAELLSKIQPIISASARFVWATKGLDETTGRFLSDVFVDIFGASRPKAILSGPSFAAEVARGIPTSVNIACKDESYANDLLKIFHTERFRVYLTHDLVGVQIAGAVKNILAIAAGISDGLGYGANTRCALITRGLAEMSRLGVKLGGEPETFMGLAGVGDLVLTATDSQSRNRRFGLALGQGQQAAEIIQSIGQVVEGAINTKQIRALAGQHAVEMPIVEQVYQVLFHDVPPTEAVHALLQREPSASV